MAVLQGFQMDGVTSPSNSTAKADGRSAKRRKKNRGGNQLPDRWIDYSPIGQAIPKARIIAFKTPLGSHFFKPDDAHRFEVGDLLRKVEEFGGRLGLVVDLTYTDKYYKAEELTKRGIAHRKIFCHGRNFEKLERAGAEFCNVLNDFFAQEAHKDKWVGVHCTHGLNRTGYLICRYLSECLEVPIEEAIKEFEEARGHPIERTEYLDKLRVASTPPLTAASFIAAQKN